MAEGGRHRSRRTWGFALAFACGLGAALIVAALAPALATSCDSTNPDGTRNCSGTDAYTYDPGCPGPGQTDQATADEELPSDATDPSYTLTTSPDPACGGVSVTSVQWPLPGTEPGKSTYRINYTVAPGNAGSHPQITIVMHFKQPAVATSTSTSTAATTPTQPTTTVPGEGNDVFVGNTCRIRLTKTVVATPGDSGEPTDYNLLQRPDGTWIAARDARVTFVISFDRYGHDCPDFELDDVVPQGFAVDGVDTGEHKEGKATFDRASGTARLSVGGFSGALGVQHVANLEIDGTFTGGQTLTNVATVPGTGAESNPVTITLVDPAVVERLQADASGAQGEAGVLSGQRRSLRAGAPATRIAHVDVAVWRTSGGKRRCTFLDGRGRLRAHRTKAGCAPVWLRATGTSRWRLRFARRLARGRYLVLASTVSTAGIRSSPYVRGAHRTLRVR